MRKNLKILTIKSCKTVKVACKNVIYSSSFRFNLSLLNSIIKTQTFSILKLNFKCFKLA